MRPKDPLEELPRELPVPQDDGAARNLVGQQLPQVFLASTSGGHVDLSSMSGRSVVFFFPRTGRPGETDLTPEWEQIPGACGCTSQVCGFRERLEAIITHGARVYGVSTQDPAYQKEMVTRLGVPFDVLSDECLKLTRAMSLPTFTIARQVLIKRMSWIIEEGRVLHVFYPDFPPNSSADRALHWLKRNKSP
jgi:peroxiredoxin